MKTWLSKIVRGIEKIAPIAVGVAADVTGVNKVLHGIEKAAGLEAFGLEEVVRATIIVAQIDHEEAKEPMDRRKAVVLGLLHTILPREFAKRNKPIPDGLMEQLPDLIEAQLTSLKFLAEVMDALK